MQQLRDFHQTQPITSSINKTGAPHDESNQARHKMFSLSKLFLLLAAGFALVAADLSALDISEPQSASFWSCVASNYNKVVIRAYQQACGVVGPACPICLRCLA